jgi:hypothetical protein
VGRGKCITKELTKADKSWKVGVSSSIPELAGISFPDDEILSLDLKDADEVVRDFFEKASLSSEA